jgi:hypothetical protein
MALKCPSCGATQLSAIPFLENFGEMAKHAMPWEFAGLMGRSVVSVYRWLTGDSHRTGSVLKCKSCQAFGMRCPWCDHIFKLSTHPGLQTMLKCPNCSKNILYDLPG